MFNPGRCGKVCLLLEQADRAWPFANLFTCPGFFLSSGVIGPPSRLKSNSQAGVNGKKAQRE